MGIEEKLPAGFLLTTVEGLAGYMRKSSMWPATFGLACCAIEMMAVGTPDYDIARFGMERFSATPRQADLMIVAGRVSQKMAPVVRQVYDQMPKPKWVISMGVCASSGGMFNNYAIVQGVDHIIPVDIYLPGCPPRPEMLLNAIITLHDQIQSDAARRQPRQGGPRRRGGRPQRDADARHEGPAGVSDGTTSDPGNEGPTAATTEAGLAQEYAAQPPGGSGHDLPTRWSSVSARACSARPAARTPPATAGCAAAILLPGASSRPYGGYYDQVADALERAPRRGPGDLVGGRRAGHRRPRRDDDLRAPRAPGRRGPDAARRARPPVRDVHRRLRRALPRTRPAASCTRSTTSSRSPTAAGGSGSRSPAPTTTRTSRRSSRSTPPTTGTSARPGTCSASSSTVTRR